MVVSLTGFFWLTQRAVGETRQEMAVLPTGARVNVSATVAELADTGTPAVLAALAQGGLAAATRSLAIGTAALGIRVNAVFPGHHPDRHAPDRRLRRPQRPGSPARPRGPGQRRRGRRLVASSPRPTSPARSCTSTAVRSPVTVNRYRCLRELTPSLVNTLRRCHSTVRVLIKS